MFVGQLVVFLVYFIGIEAGQLVVYRVYFISEITTQSLDDFRGGFYEHFANINLSLIDYRSVLED